MKMGTLFTIINFLAYTPLRENRLITSFHDLMYYQQKLRDIYLCPGVTAQSKYLIKHQELFILFHI